MTIKEVSERFGMSTDTLRYYERIGLIPQIARTAGGIRDYKISKYENAIKTGELTWDK